MVDLKTIIWIIQIILQELIGGFAIKSIHDAPTLAILRSYDQLTFEANVVFGLVFLLNFVVRRYITINDTSYLYIQRLHLEIQRQSVTDIICFLITAVYITREILLLLPLY